MQQARYFLLLCEELSFSRAARRCHVGQPSLSKAIRALETELGGALFLRKPSLALSELGHAVKPHLQRIVWAHGEARAAARRLVGARREPAEPVRASGEGA
jgi:DNA-binding transcriptional LysR family regulator